MIKQFTLSLHGKQIASIEYPDGEEPDNPFDALMDIFWGAVAKKAEAEEVTADDGQRERSPD